MTPRTGEIFWYEIEDGRRPVLVVTRTGAAAVLRRIVVAPITRRIRGVPSEISLGASEGLRDACVATFDNLHVVSRANLTERVGTLGPRRDEICRALAALADC